MTTVIRCRTFSIKQREIDTMPTDHLIKTVTFPTVSMYDDLSLTKITHTSLAMQMCREFIRGNRLVPGLDLSGLSIEDVSSVEIPVLDINDPIDPEICSQIEKIRDLSYVGCNRGETYVEILSKDDQTIKLFLYSVADRDLPNGLIELKAEHSQYHRACRALYEKSRVLKGIYPEVFNQLLAELGPEKACLKRLDIPALSRENILRLQPHAKKYPEAYRIIKEFLDQNVLYAKHSTRSEDKIKRSGAILSLRKLMAMKITDSHQQLSKERTHSPEKSSTEDASAHQFTYTSPEEKNNTKLRDLLFFNNHRYVFTRLELHPKTEAPESYREVFIPLKPSDLANAFYSPDFFFGTKRILKSTAYGDDIIEFMVLDLLDLAERKAFREFQSEATPEKLAPHVEATIDTYTKNTKAFNWALRHSANWKSCSEMELKFPDQLMLASAASSRSHPKDEADDFDDEKQSARALVNN